MKEEYQSGLPLSSRLEEIDLLRALAILLVIGRHILFIPPNTPAFIKTLVLSWKEFGWIGVDLFFVLSGFLVSGLLFKEFIQTGRVSIGRFLLRRALKLYPAFYVFLILGTPLAYTLTNTSSTVRGILGEVFFLQNYIGSLWLHTWSLAVEEHFYLILAGLIAALVSIKKSNNPFGFVPYLFTVVAFVLLTIRSLLGFGFNFKWHQILTPTHFRIDSLFFGVFLSYLYYFKHEKIRRFFINYSVLTTVLAIFLLSPAVFLKLNSNPFLYTIGFTFFYFGFGSLLMNFLFLPHSIKNGFLKIFGFLPLIGRHSYSIYLWHVASYVISISMVRHWRGKDDVLLEVPIYFGLSLIIGVGMSKLIEQPILMLRNRIFPSRSGNIPLGSMVDSRTTK